MPFCWQKKGRERKGRNQTPNCFVLRLECSETICHFVYGASFTCLDGAQNSAAQWIAATLPIGSNGRIVLYGVHCWKRVNFICKQRYHLSKWHYYRTLTAALPCAAHRHRHTTSECIAHAAKGLCHSAMSSLWVRLCPTVLSYSSICL